MPNVIYCDSFDHYATADLSRRYATVGAAVAIGAYGRNSTNGVRSTSASSGWLGVAIAARASVYVEVAFKLPSLIASPIIALLEGAGIHVAVQPSATGELSVLRNSTVLATTSGLGLLSGTYYHVGLYAAIHDTTGAYDLRVNGVSVLPAANVDTRNAGTSGLVDSIQLRSVSTSATDFDDLIISTDGFCGDCRVKALLPNGAGNYSEWTASAGAGYTCVDETSVNGDIDYVASATATQRSTYTFPSLGVTGNIKAVQHVSTLRKDDAGSRTAKQTVRIGSSNYDGSDITVTDSYVMQRRMMTTSPATSAAWNSADLNNGAIEAGTLLVS